ncbi:hypothetical protein [Komagataeibacter swingsii]|uniref:Uncharacterized protein n=1 Tax=Komagataeibacter swingsii TaxID=215220 RepID=A0A2V4RJF6_9PROT|nr:hypothetical protein [Komagataeibacter swingsii]PYD69134.1 hypothetical protein CFR76_11525 [Komagataeibacter swingsii]GBQ57233.1 hypothetical protein AA16373_0949 [Komagataeibacter swingsii DSM 16373]
MTPAVDTIASAPAVPPVVAGLSVAPDEVPTRSQTTRMIYSRHRRALRDYARTLATNTDNA